MTNWVVVPCDVCNKQTITEAPDVMVVCETCLDRWDAEDASGIPSLADDGFLYDARSKKEPTP